MEETLRELGEYITRSLAGAARGYRVEYGELTVDVNAEGIVKAVTFLRDDGQCQFINIIDVCGADYPARDKRFDVVYHFLSPKKNLRVRLKVQAGEGEAVPSICDVFPGANWFEREAYDLYGILFTGHPELRRLLTDYGFDGYPLRKDFPLTGFVEVRWDDELKRVVYEPVKLTQEFRNFDFLSPWEGVDYTLPGDEKGARTAPTGGTKGGA